MKCPLLLLLLLLLLACPFLKGDELPLAFTKLAQDPIEGYAVQFGNPKKGEASFCVFYRRGKTWRTILASKKGLSDDWRIRLGRVSIEKLEGVDLTLFPEEDSKNRHLTRLTAERWFVFDERSWRQYFVTSTVLREDLAFREGPTNSKMPLRVFIHRELYKFTSRGKE